MSRCFPFPPPGYEKKARLDDPDLLTKEKHKERKHKKDRKEKEKREGKEKKDKHRSKEKHKDKKERKEKHKDGSKEKNQVSGEERIIEGQQGFYTRENTGSIKTKNNEFQDSKYVQELVKRTSDVDGASGSQMVQKTVAADHRKSEVQGTVMVGCSDNCSRENERSRIVQRVTATDNRRPEPWGMAMETSTSQQSSEKERVKSKNEDIRAFNGQRNHVNLGSLDKSSSHNNLSLSDQERVKGIAKMAVKSDVEEKDKNKRKEGGRENKKWKEKDRNKDKKRDERVKEAREANKDQPKLTETVPKLKESSKDTLDFRLIKPSDPAKLSSASSSGGNLGKRKELEMNGIILENGIRPNKLSRSLSPSDAVLENGRKAEPSQSATQSVHDKQVTAGNHRLHVRDHKMNGLVVGQPPNLSSAKSSPATAPLNANGDASARSPHPDTKYLSRILSVPKMEELQDLLDQDWLFSGSHRDSMKLDKISSENNGNREAWSEALQLESADITALPYVIPY